MSLRLQLNLLVASLLAASTVLVLVFHVAGTRTGVREETLAAHRVAIHLLQHIVAISGEVDVATLGRSLDRLGRVRSADITLRDASGRVLHSSPPSPYKAGRNAPAWFTALVEPPPMDHVITLHDGTLQIHANASRSVIDGWDRGVFLLQIGALTLVVGTLLGLWLVGRLTRPLRTIVHGLEGMQAGAYHTRLPALPTTEAAAIANAFNAAAAAVEDNLEARREALAARLRLTQSRELAAAVQAGVERERKFIAQELHDEAAQSITAIRSLAQALAQDDAAGERQREVARMIVETSGALHGTLHDLIPRLRPPSLDDRDLTAAIEDLLAVTQRQRPELEFVLRVAEALPAPPEPVALAAYRIVQEALTNVLRHADAHRVEIRLAERAGSLEVEITDDGRGLRADWESVGHYGIRGMDERAHSLGGDFAIGNGAQRGVRVRARLPLEAVPA